MVVRFTKDELKENGLKIKLTDDGFEFVNVKKCHFMNGEHHPCKYFIESDLDIEGYQEGFTVCPGCGADLDKTKHAQREGKI